jgi:hypothetical protein
MMRKLGLISLLMLLISSAALAQSGGQLWVRSYEDRNSNGVRDTGEPLLTRGVSVELVNSDGIVIASALLDNSPNAAQGLVGFQMLPAGTYSVNVSSADYEATGETQFTTTVSDAGVPPVLEFGAAAVEIPEMTAPAGEEGMSTVLLAAIAALVVVVVMAIIGLLIHTFFFRPRLKQAQQMDMRTTGGMRPVATGTGEYVVPRGTGQMPRQTGTGEFQRPTGTGQMPRQTGTGEFQRPSGTGEFQRPRSTGEFGRPAAPPPAQNPVIDEYDFPLDSEDTPRP